MLLRKQVVAATAENEWLSLRAVVCFYASPKWSGHGSGTSRAIGGDALPFDEMHGASHLEPSVVYQSRCAFEKKLNDFDSRGKRKKRIKVAQIESRN